MGKGRLAILFILLFLLLMGVRIFFPEGGTMGDTFELVKETIDLSQIRKTDLGEEYEDIMYGDFSRVIGIEEDRMDELELVTENMKSPNCDKEWMIHDVNGDGLQELILAQKESRTYPFSAKIYAIFIHEDNYYRRVLWDILDEGEFFFLCEKGLAYYSDDYGVYSYNLYLECSFNDNWEIVEGDRFEWFEIEDFTEFCVGVREEERAHLNIYGPGTYFLYTESNSQESVVRHLTKEEWKKKYEECIGDASQVRPFRKH